MASMRNDRARVSGLPEPVRTRPAVVKTLIAAMLAVLFAGFLAMNLEDVTVEFLYWETTLPLWLLLLVSAVSGVLIWELASYLRRRRR